jgi:cytochrome c
MDSFELNKILGAILGTCILVLVTSFAAQAVFTPKALEKPGFEIAVKEASHGAAGAAAAAPSDPI